MLEEIGGGENATQKALNFKISAQACFVYSLEKQGVSAAFLKCFFFCLFFSMLNAAGFGQWGVYKNKFFFCFFRFFSHSFANTGWINSFFFFNRLYARKSKIYSWHIGLDTTDSLVCIYVCFFCILLWKNNVHIMSKTVFLNNFSLLLTM